MRNVLLLLALTLLSISPAATAQSLEGWPDWVKQNMQNEAKRLKFREVETHDKSFRSKLPGKTTEPEQMEDGWYFTADIKAGVPVECYVFTSARDLATLLDWMAETNVNAVAGNYGEIATRRFYAADSGVVAGMPYLSLEWIYTIEGEEQMLVGFTKVRAATKGERAYVCTHNNLGYRDSMARIFDEFVTNAELADPTPTPFYEEVIRVDMSGPGAGVAHASYRNEETGEVTAFIAEASITAVDPSTISVSDSFTATVTEPDGTMIKSFVITVENGEIASELDLDRNEAGGWMVSGTLQGKEVQFAIDGDVEPASELRQLALAREVFREGATSAEAAVWLPSLDPSQFIVTTMTRDDAEVERQAKMQLGPIAYTGLFDDEGNMYDATVSVGPVNIKIERVWSRGSVLQ